MNLLFLSHRIPFPPDKGDKIRSFYEIKYLSQKHNVYLGTILENEGDRPHINALKNFCKNIHAIQFDSKIKLIKSLFTGYPFSVTYFYDKKLQDYVDRILEIEKINAIICYCSSMAEYIFRSPRFRENRLPGVKLIIDYVDLDSDKWQQYASYTRFPYSLIYRIENRRLFEFEKKINSMFNHSIFVSSREEKVFKGLYPEAKNIHVIPNGVDYEYFSNDKSKESSKSGLSGEPILVFTGFMDYFANEDGVTWFSRKILPKIRVDFPKAQFYIVGNKPTRRVRKLSNIPGVIVTGYVQDIRKYYSIADVCVIPLRIARGLQNKILEAMATGNAVVATSNASDGIICHDNDDIVIADNEEEFANEVISLLKDHGRRKVMGQRAVENIRRHYDWGENLKAFDEVLGSN